MIKNQKNILILIGVISLACIIVFLLASKDISDYTVADTQYSSESKNRLQVKTIYGFNKEDFQNFSRTLGEWNSIDFRYSDAVYTKLNADVLMSRAYTKDNHIVWIDMINSKAGQSFHKQRVIAESAGWTIDNESIAEFSIASNNPFAKLYANRLDISKQSSRQVMIYWFTFKRYGISDNITMIRISSPVIDNEAATFDYIKNFVEEQLFNALYKTTVPENITVAEYITVEYGIPGMAAIVLMVLVPIGIVIIGIRRKD